jgi:hypothetical protein
MRTRAAQLKMSLLQRIAAALRGRRSEQVLVLMNTTRGQRAVPVDLRDLR